MTNGSPNTPPEPPEQPSLVTRLGRFIRRPSTLIGGGLLIVLGVGGYVGIQYFVYERLSPLVEAQLSNFINRKVNLGEVESFSLNHIRFGNSSIPATAKDPGNLSLKAVEIEFNPIPFFLGRPFPLEVTIVDPNLYLKQDKTGKWADIEIPKSEKEFPIDFDVKVNLIDADAALKAYQLKNVVTVKASGNARYTKTDVQDLQYDLDVDFLKSQVNLKGQSVIESGKTKLDLTVRRLALTELVALIPNSPVKLNKGEFNADLNVNVPSLENIKGTQGQGQINLSQIAGRIPTLQVPIKASTQIRLQGQKVLIDQFEANVNSIVAQAKGDIDWQKGYNLNVEVKPFKIVNLAKIFSLALPVNVDGQLQLKLKVTGAVTNPLILGNINNKNSVLIDKLNIKNLSANFRTNLNQLWVRNVQIQPAAGGQILATGQIQLGILNSLKAKRPIDWGKMPVTVAFKGDFPGEGILKPYVNFPQEVTVGTINTEGKLQGTFDRLRTLITWQTNNLATVSDVKIAGSGTIFWAGYDVLIRDTRLQTDQGNLLVNASGNLKRKDWQTLVNAKSFDLDPFVAILCGNFTNVCSYTTAIQPVRLETANIQLAGRLDNFGLDTLKGLANLNLKVQQGEVALNSRILQGNINATVFASQLAVNPFLPNISIPVNVISTQAKLSGPIEQLLNQNWNSLQADADIRLQVDNNPVNIIGQVEQGNLQAVVNTQEIPLNQFIPNLTVPVSIQRTQAIIKGSLDELLELNVNSLTASTNVNLNIDNNPARLISRVENGFVEAVANLRSLSLNRLIPQLPVPADLTSSQVNLSGNLQSLISSVLEKKLDLSNVRATVNLDLAVADGTVTTLTQLNNNQWQSNIIGSNINTTQLLRNLAPNIQQQYTKNLPDANAQLSLSGSINPLFDQNESLAIRANSVLIQLGEQTLNASGNIQVTNLFTRPDASANLLVSAAANLNKLPTTQLLSGIPNPQGLLPQRLDVAGNANFQGRFIAQNIFTAPTAPGNLQLSGNLRLVDFAFNNRKFDPILTGTVNAVLGQEIALDLRGQDDIIAAVAEPCTRPDCLSPYLPVSFTLRQTTNNQAPILAQGRRVGERLLAEIESFPLQVLNISPFSEYGVRGVVEGIVNLDVDVNLFTLAGRGNLNVNQPGLGIFKADTFRAGFAYQDRIASLTAATLVTGNSQYNVEGSLNFDTGAILAKANVDDGNIEDFLAAVGSPDLPTLISFIQQEKPNFIDAAGVGTYSVGAPGSSIATQVNLYSRIAQYIKALARERQKSGVPTELDLQGVYQADLALAGTLEKPEVNVQFQGNNWKWNPQSPYPNIIEPIGFLMQDTRTIPINEVTLKASFNDGVIAIQPARLVVQNSVVFLQAQANLSTGKLAGNFGVEDLSADTINNFVTVPLDLAGNLDIGGNLGGTISNPRIAGNFAFSDGAFNARLLDQTIEGNFNLADWRFQLATTETSFIKLYASIPYPPLANNELVEVRLNLGTDALKLVDILTNNQISWVSGEGQVNARATGRLNVEKGIKIQDLAVNGQVLLENAAIASSAIPEIATVNGQIVFDRQLLNVQQLSATFAESQIIATGVLPFFEQLPSNSPQAANPLTVVVEQGDIKLDDLYEGQIDGQVVVNGSALKPVIGGTVRLYDGHVFVPKRDEEENQPTPVANQWLVATKQIQSAPIAPRLENFQVILNNLRVEQDPLYDFNFGGQIAINGTFTDINSLQPTGVVQLNRGIINFVDTRFLIDRRYPNQIVFDPAQGLLNPYLNVRMRTIASDFPNLQRQQRSEFSNEIPDDNLNQVRRIDISLGIDGRLSQLLPGFARDLASVCQIFPDLPPVSIQSAYSQQQLNQLETCLRTVATTKGGKANEQLLSNPAVTLSSSPPRSKAEILNLLGNQLLEVAQALQGNNTEQLIEYGVVQLAFPLLLQNVAYDVENSVAKALNMTDFRFLPYLEAVYRVNKNQESFVRFSYDYTFNEVRVQYETKF